MSRAGHSSAADALAGNPAAAGSKAKPAHAVRRKFDANGMMFLPSVCSCFYVRDHGDGHRTSSTIFPTLSVHQAGAPRCPVSDVLPCVMMLARARESG